MKNSGKAGILIIGIFIGMIVGISIAAWLDYKGFEINPLHKISQYFFLEKNNENRNWLFANNNDSLRNIKDQSYNPKSGNPGILNDSTSSYNAGSFKQESIQSDSLPVSIDRSGDVNPEEPIKLATDQLIDSRAMKVTGLVATKGNNLDSLLIDDKYSGHLGEIVKVELWYSPINYSGYKWSNNKLVIFGFYDIEMVKLKFLDDAYFFNYGTIYYHLEQTPSFKNLELIQDASLIKKLNSL